MKKCTECRAFIGGNGDVCPLCGSKLQGEGGPENWPHSTQLKRAAEKFKLQFKIVLASLIIIIVSGIGAPGGFNLSTAGIIALWIVTGEIILVMALRGQIRIPTLFTVCAIAVVLLLLVTGFLYPEAHQAIPIILAAILVLNFILTWTDKAGWALLYFVVTFLAFIAVWIVITLSGGSASLSWMICFGIAIGAFTIIFLINGRRIIEEITKRAGF